jgi:manganese-dependent inorganic pyrophosphatase
VSSSLSAGRSACRCALSVSNVARFGIVRLSLSRSCVSAALPAERTGHDSAGPEEDTITTVYVSGHRNPDLDSIGSAIGYAELKQRLRSDDRYVPVRLGPVNAQTRWALDRSGADEPDFLRHIRLRVRDVMQHCAVTVAHDAPVREVGRAMTGEGLDLVAVTDEHGALAGVVSERDLARMYVRESQSASTFEDRPVRLSAINEVLGGRILAGEDREVSGRLWVVAVDVGSMEDRIGAGDIAVVGDRPDAQRRALELGVAVLITSYDTEPGEDLVALAREHDAAVVVSPLDSYVTGRMVQLAVPCATVMSREPLTAAPDDLLAEVADRIKDVEYRAAIAIDEDGAPVGIVSRSDLVSPSPRQVLLVDHAEQAQSVPGIEEAEIVEILDHHHIGSIETRIPVKATFDPVGSTATLVVERFRREGREPKRPTATMLLAALLSDTVVLTSPTTTDRDEQVVAYLEELLELDARKFGMEMFEASSDASDLGAEEIVARDAKEYTTAAGHTIAIAQFETVGTGLLERRAELLEALEAEREKRGYALYALMVTDIVSRGTELLVAGDTGPVERAFGVRARDSALELPGVMSRKKQVAPKLLANA